MNASTKTLVLHIGSEKTGSKSIRYSLARSARHLARRYQILYPSAAPLFLRNAHYPILSPFLDVSEQDFVPANRRITTAVLQHALAAADKRHSPRTILLSAEHLSSRLLPESISALGKVLRLALPDHAIKIVYHVRSQTSQYCAALSTHIKTLGIDILPITGINRSNRFLDHWRVASDWADVFGKENILIQNYHTGDALETFYQTLGIDARDRRIIKPHRRNTSLSLEQATILLEVNSGFGAPDFENEVLFRLRRHVQGSLAFYLSYVLRKERPLLSILSPADLVHFGREFGECNDQLQRDFGLDFNLNDFMDVDVSETRLDHDDTLDSRFSEELTYWRNFIGRGPLSAEEAEKTARRMRRLLIGKHLRELLTQRTRVLIMSRRLAARI